MTAPLDVEAKTTALLLMDYQRFVLDNFLPEALAEQAVANAATVLEAARAAGMLVIHVTVGFRSGYPEISPRSRMFSWLKESGLVEPGNPQTAIHPALAPRENEPVVVKHRVGAFTSTDLERLLRAQGIESLLIAGVTTSGVVLSTTRQAADLDYEIVVIGNACADPDDETQALLIAKILPPQASVVDADGINMLV